MHRLHKGMTIAAQIKPGKSEDLRCYLISLNDPQKNNASSPFSLSDTILNITGVIIPFQEYNRKKLPETFVLTTGFCGPLSVHLNELIQIFKKMLVGIFKYCEDFPENGLITDVSLKRYLRTRSRKSVFFSRYNCITKEDVRREQCLKLEIANYVDQAQEYINLNKRTALEVKTLIERHIRSMGQKYEWSYHPVKYTLYEWVVTNRTPIIKKATVPILVALLIRAITIKKFTGIGFFVLVVLMAIVLNYIATWEKTIPAIRPSDDHVRKIAATQLHPVLNEMTAAAPLKGGFLRRILYNISLRIANLVGSNIPTVNQIRWLTINNGKRLLFTSVYTNTTDFYVRDFLVGNIPRGVNFMFSHGKGFPDAGPFYNGGIEHDPEGFMNSVHTGQLVTDLWYCHEPNLPADNIRNNRTLRNGLFRKMNEKEANNWLKLI